MTKVSLSSPTRSQRRIRVDLVLAALLFLNCGDESAPMLIATLPDAAADRAGADAGAVPETPTECDDVLPSAALDTPPPNKGFEELSRARAVGNDVYYRSLRTGAIWAVTVPDGAPRLIVPAVAGAPFQDFWVEGETVFIASLGALYVAPRSGGPATLSPNHQPLVPPATGEDWTWKYVRAGDFLYYTHNEATLVLRRVRWTGGTPEVVGQVTQPLGDLVAGDSAVYISTIGTNARPATPNALWSVSIADNGALIKIFEVDRSFFLLGFNDGLYARLETEFGTAGVAFFSPSFAWGQTPALTHIDRGTLHFGSARFDGDLYFLARQWFRVPGGEDLVQMPVLLRARGGMTEPELLRCVSLERGSVPPHFEQFLFGNLGSPIGSEDGVFLPAGPSPVSRPGATSTYPHVVKLWPPP